MDIANFGSIDINKLVNVAIIGGGNIMGTSSLNRSILTINLKSCPNCGEARYKYNSIEERKLVRYRDKEIVLHKKYVCLNCGLELD